VQRCYPDHADSPDDDTLATAYAWPVSPTDRAMLRANMVAAIDAGAVLAGKSEGLGSSADQRLLVVLRDLADVVLVGAGTIRAEGYGGIRLGTDRLERRARWGFGGPPPIAVVTRRGLDRELGIFTDNEVQPIVITSTAGAARMSGHPATVIEAGTDSVEMGAAVRALAGRGFRRILCEGGPSLLGSLVAERLVDELCLTTSPITVGAGPTTLLGAVRLTEPAQWRLQTLHVDGSHVFSRYSFRRSSQEDR
jgi:riboflavin biosynthesis pyrimidine reductase